MSKVQDKLQRFFDSIDGDSKGAYDDCFTVVSFGDGTFALRDGTGIPLEKVSAEVIAAYAAGIYRGAECNEYDEALEVACGTP